MTRHRPFRYWYPAMESLFDTHAHLDFKDFKPDFELMLKRASDAGVSRIITIGSGDGLVSAPAAVAIADGHDCIWATVGVHPHDAALGLPFGNPPDSAPSTDFNASWLHKADAAVRGLKTLASNPKVVGIGEAGLDYHYNFSPKAVQREMFRLMIGLANETGKPIIIHDREADDDTMAILRECLEKGRTGTFHCFSGDTALARRVLDLGFHISIPGIVTFKNASIMADVVRFVPTERMLLETDAPYLAPVPHRGKRNEPAFVAETAARIAAIKGLSIDDVARITTQNAVRLFRLGPDHQGDRIAYPIRDSLYLNITNRCTLACTFCAKRKDWSVKGHDLMLEREPETAEILASIEPVWRKYRELVFCGYGEPLLRPQIVEDVARTMKSRGMTVRVNTDGLANMVHGRDVTAALDGLVDVYSVSLNAPDAKIYAKICPSRHGEAAYEAAKRFIISAKARAEVVATAVELPGLDVDAIRRVAEIELGVRFRSRPFNEVG